MSWKIIPGFDKYEANEEGQIRSKKNERILISNYKNQISLINNNGKRETHQVAHIIALTFIPNPENKKYVVHKDKDLTNNNISNLEWSNNPNISRDNSEYSPEEIEASYKRNNGNIKAVINEIGASKVTIYRILRKLGYTFSVNKEEIIAYYEVGLNSKEISKITGYTRSKISIIIEQHLEGE